MSQELENEIESALAQYEQRQKWKEWGLLDFRKQGACVLMYGPPGTGKTTIAMYMAKRLSKGLVTLNMKDIGGKAPGDNERAIDKVFKEAHLRNKTVILDEAEAILWDRSKAGTDMLWMIGTIDELLMQIAKCPELVIICTNRMEMMDTALESRCFAMLQVGVPEYKERIRLWEQKMPTRFPLKLTTANIEKLATLQLVGRAIETAIVKEASHAIRENRDPSFTSLLQVVQTLASK